MAIYQITYGSGSGSGGWSVGNLMLINNGAVNCLPLLRPDNNYPTSGSTIISSPTAPVVGQSFSTFFAGWTATVLSSVEVTQKSNISLRNPGTKFNIKLQDVVAALIGAYWGVKVTVQ